MTYLAVYTKFKPKDKWSLYTIAETMEAAKKHSKYAVKQAKIIGYAEAKSTVQGFESAHDIPKMLDVVKPEKLLYN